MQQIVFVDRNQKGQFHKGITPHNKFSGQHTQVTLGEKFGEWVVISLDILRDDVGEVCVLCQCTHTTQVVRLSNLRNKQSNGCRLCFKERITKRTAEESYWLERFRNIRARCYNQRCPTFKHYGGRGISIHSAWLENPLLFVSWAIENSAGKDKECLEIDRINNDGNYSPDNCRLVSSAINARNKRTTKLVEYQGETYCLTDFHRKFTTVAWSVFYRYFKKSSSPEDCLQKLQSVRRNKRRT